MNAVPHFAQSYAEARDKFLAAGAARGARMFRDVHPSVRGAQGEELSIDLAQIGDDKAPALFLLSSGTHGVEGFCGSGCQVALLHDGAFVAAVERSGVCVLMLHALNPYGFSHLQRTNEDNADLNRNFVDFAAPLPDGGAYAEIHALLASAGLAAASGHNLPAPTVSTTPHPSSSETLAWIVFMVGAIIILLAWTASLRARPLHRFGRPTSST